MERLRCLSSLYETRIAWDEMVLMLQRGGAIQRAEFFVVVVLCFCGLEQREDKRLR